MTEFPLTTLAILLALLVYFGLSIPVGMARGRYGVAAPATSGHPEFDRRYRVHVNTLEQLALFVPAAVLAAPVLGDMVTAGIGLVWSLGRILFARLYYANPDKRGPGFALTLLPSLILIGAAAWGAASHL